MTDINTLHSIFEYAKLMTSNLIESSTWNPIDFTYVFESDLDSFGFIRFEFDRFIWYSTDYRRFVKWLHWLFNNQSDEDLLAECIIGACMKLINLDMLFRFKRSLYHHAYHCRLFWSYPSFNLKLTPLGAFTNMESAQDSRLRP